MLVTAAVEKPVKASMNKCLYARVVRGISRLSDASQLRQI